MTREVSGWVVAGVLAVLLVSMGAMQQAGRVGRFQIVSLTQPAGFKDEDGDTVPRTLMMTMLLDTETGDVRRLIYVVDRDGNDRGSWAAPFGRQAAP